MLLTTTMRDLAEAGAAVVAAEEELSRRREERDAAIIAAARGGPRRSYRSLAVLGQVSATHVMNVVRAATAEEG